MQAAIDWCVYLLTGFTVSNCLKCVVGDIEVNISSTIHT